METLQIQIPSNCEIDLQKSILSEGKIVFKKKEPMNYGEVLQKLYQNNGNQGWFNDSTGLPVVTPPDGKVPTDYWGVCISEKHAQKLKAINMLLNVGAYVNGDWQPNWPNSNESKYFLQLTWNDKIYIDWTKIYNHSVMYFKSLEAADLAIKILGKDVIRQALSTDGLKHR